MKLHFARTAMKNAIDICKKIAKDKEEAKVWVLTAGKEDLFLYTSRDSQELKYFHNFKLIQPFEEKTSFLVNPHLLDDVLKGKEKELVWEINDEKDTLISGEHKIPVTWYDGKFPIEKMNYQEMKNPENFIETIGMMNRIAGKTVVDFTIGGGEATVRSPIYIKRFSFEESEMPPMTITPEYLTLLNGTINWKKNDEKTIEYVGNEKEMILKFESMPVKKIKKETVVQEDQLTKQLYIFKNKTHMPKVKRLDGEKVHTFTINPDDMLTALREYKAPVADVYLYDWEGRLCIDPYDKRGEELEEDEDQPIQYIRYDGDMKRTKIDLEGAIAFFEGFTEKTEEEERQDEFRKALKKVKNYNEQEEKVLNALYSYGNKVTTINLYVEAEKEVLVLDPYDKKGKLMKGNQPLDGDNPEERYTLFEFSIEGKQKQLKMDVVEMKRTIEQEIEDRTKVLFEAKTNALEVNIKKFTEDEEEYFLLTSKTSLYYSILMAKKEPNYTKVQKKVDSIHEEHKKIAYLQ